MWPQRSGCVRNPRGDRNFLSLNGSKRVKKDPNTPQASRAAQLGRLLRTVRHLAPGQAWHRGRRLLADPWRRLAGSAERYGRVAETLALPRFDHPGLQRLATLRASRIAPDAALETARNALEGRFRFLGRSLELGREVAWFDPRLDTGTRLWKTLLHEFPYSLDLALAERASADGTYRRRFSALFESWSQAAPLDGHGAYQDAWNARAVANRLMAWSVAGALFGFEPSEAEGRTLGRALLVHSLYLRDNLEWDLRANHLLRDAVGLVVANDLMGCAPEGLALLEAQVSEQVLPDGCHVERVPLYHALALQDLVEVRVLLGERSPDWLSAAVSHMAHFLETLLSDDGELPLFGDTWHGELDARRLLAEAAADVTTPVEARPEPLGAGPEHHSGLVVLRSGSSHLVIRAGAHGPDYQLGHAHADGLSFELSSGATRIVTDTGTATYDSGPARDRARSTAAHNTVQIDGREQIECWGSFRVGRRGRGQVRGQGSQDGWEWLWASHDGYRWLAGNPLHQRLWVVCERAALILDAVTGRGRHGLRSALHFHPDAPADRYRVTALGASVRRTPAPLHERFNSTREMTELYVELEAGLPWLGGWLIELDPKSPPSRVEWVAERGVAAVRLRSGTLHIDLRWDPTQSDPGRGPTLSPPLSTPNEECAT